MKIFRFCGMALVAVCMCVNFTACSSGDGLDDGEGSSINEKKLTKMVFDGEPFTFSYDNQGRVIEVVDVYAYGESTSYYYIWDDDAIIVNSKTEVVNPDGYTEKHTDRHIYSIDNKRVQSSGENENIETYYYNNQNRLSQIKSRWDIDDYLWDGDKLIAVNDGSDKYTYKESCKKGYSPLFVMRINSDPLFMAHPEIIGVRTEQLPATITETLNDGSTKIYTYSYTFDNEGYISKIEIANNEKKSTCILTWE